MKIQDAEHAQKILLCAKATPHEHIHSAGIFMANEANQWKARAEQAEAERDRLRAELEGLKQQEPVGYVGDGHIETARVHGWLAQLSPEVLGSLRIPVYAQPKPAPSTDDSRDAARYRWLTADFGNRHSLVFRKWDGESIELLGATIDAAMREVGDGIQGG